MTIFGKNMKLTVSTRDEAALHAAFTEGLGARTVTPEASLTVYTFTDGFNIGVYFVDDDTLSAEQLQLGPWLELLVDDLDDAHDRLERLGVPVLHYERDPAHVYRQLPGGPVFRLGSSR